MYHRLAALFSCHIIFIYMYNFFVKKISFLDSILKVLLYLQRFLFYLKTQCST